MYLNLGLVNSTMAIISDMSAIGDIDIERPRALPPGSRRDSIPVSENLIS